MGIGRIIGVKYYWTGFCVAIALTSVAIVIACSSPTIGYENSIYTATPLAFWFLVMVSITIGVAMVVNEVARNWWKKRWMFAVSVLVLNSIVILLLSVLRGYYAIGTDTLMHIGYVKDLSNGIVSAQNAYPVVHVFPTLLVLLGVPAHLATNLSPIFCYVVYVFSFYMLARLIWGDKREVIICTALSAFLLLPMGDGLKATLVAASMFPLTLLVVLKLRQGFSIKQLAVFLAFIAIISLMHPLALETMLIAVIIACLLPIKVNRWRYAVTAIAIVPLAIWWYAYWFDINVIGAVWRDFGEAVVSVGNGGGIPSTDSSGVVSELPALVVEAENVLLPPTEGIMATQVTSNYSFISLIMRRYGTEILLGVVACICLFMMAWRYIRGIDRTHLYLYFGLLFVILNVMWVAGWYLEMSVYDLALVRMLNWVPAISIIIVTPTMARLFDYWKIRRISMVVVLLLMALIANATLFNIYRSPIMGIPSIQVTEQQLRGMKWLIENGNPDMPIVYMTSHRTSRFVAAMNGVEWVRNHQKMYWLHENTVYNFDYNDGYSLGHKVDEDIYLIVTKMDRLLPKWEEKKLYLLETDPNLEIIYKDSDEFQVWYVHSVENQWLKLF